MIKQPLSISAAALQIAFVMAGIVVIPTLAEANVSLPSIFNNHMVLQEGVKVPIWGSADPGEEIKVTFGGGSVSTILARS